jgi:hypothetical protein
MELMTARRAEPEGDDVIEREAARVQAELLRVLHADREARTRTMDGPPRKGIMESAVPFVVGVLLGVLGTYSAFSGRLATLEAVQSQQTREISETHTALLETRVALNELLSYTRAHQSTFSPTRKDP